jgi:hypothetical protein
VCMVLCHICGHAWFLPLLFLLSDHKHFVLSLGVELIKIKLIKRNIDEESKSRECFVKFVSQLTELGVKHVQWLVDPRLGIPCMYNYNVYIRICSNHSVVLKHHTYENTHK